MSAEDEVLYTAAHALRHSFRRLTWLVDLHLQLHQDDLDWDRLAEIASHTGMERPVVYGMWLLRQGELDLPAPADRWMESARVRPMTAWLLEKILAARASTCGGEVLWCLSGARGLDRVRRLAEFVFPRPDVLLQVFPRLPRRLAPLAYPLRCGQLVLRGVTELAAVARRPGTRL